MADKMFENNQVSIIGEIVSDFQFSHEVYGEGFYMMELSDMLASRPDDVTVIMTGRVLDDGIREMADEIYNIASEK